MLARAWNFLLAAVFALAATGMADEGAPRGETVVFGDDLQTPARQVAPWVKSFAKNAGGEVVNALRPGWKSADVWYVRDILEQHPHAGAFVILATPAELAQINTVDPEAVARVGARFGYMADILHEAAPAARIMLVAPPQIDPARHAGYPESALITSEMLASNLEKAAQTRGIVFVNLLDRFPAGATVFPAAPAEQEKMGKILALELREPATVSQPLCARPGRVAPPAAGRPATDDRGARDLAAAIAADLAAMPAVETSAPERPAGPAVIRKYLCNRDLRSVVSEEGVALASGAMNGIRGVLDAELAEQEETRMNAMFNFPGADEFAVITREPPVNEALISAIVPPQAAEGFAGAVVDWDAVPVPENPAFNAVALGAGKKPADAEKEEKETLPQGVRLADFSDDPDAVEVPGMTEFDREPALAEVVREPAVIARAETAAEQDLSRAPWNKPVEVKETPAAADDAARAGESVRTAAIANADYPLPDAEGGADEVPAVKIDRLFNGERTVAAVAREVEEVSRFVNKESTMLPLAAAAQTGFAGYAVYVHTAAE